MIGICFVSFVLVAPPAEPPPKLITVELKPGTDDDKSLAPRYSPPGSRLDLTAKPRPDLPGFDHLESRAKLGPDAKAGPGQVLVIARSEKGKPYDLLFPDGKPDAKLPRIEPKVVRGKVWSTFNAVLPVAHGKAEAPEPYPVSLWVVVEKEADVPDLIRISRRGYLTGKVKVADLELSVVLSDANNDAVFGTGDWWELKSATGKPAGDAMRTVGDFAWGAGKSWKLELDGTNGRRGLLVPFESGTTQEDDAISRDRLREDRAAPRAAKPVPFRKDIDVALKEVSAAKAAYFLKFETDWCGPCKQMDALVFTARDVAESAAGLTCITVDGDARKELVERHAVKAYPTGVLIGPDGTEIARFTGYRSVKQMAEFFKQAKK